MGAPLDIKVLTKCERDRGFLQVAQRFPGGKTSSLVCLDYNKLGGPDTASLAAECLADAARRGKPKAELQKLLVALATHNCHAYRRKHRRCTGTTTTIPQG